MPDPWRDETLLPADELAPGLARRIVRAALEERGWADVLDGALLLSTELVTNCVVHAGTNVKLTLEGSDQQLTVTVQDLLPGRITMTPGAEELGEGGRGLLLVHALAMAWGTEHSKEGKSVWFRFERPSAAAEAAATPPTTAPERHNGTGPVTTRLTRVDLPWLTGAGSGVLAELTMTEFLAEMLARAAETLGAARGVVILDDEGTGEPGVAAHLGVGRSELTEIGRRLAGAHVRPRLPQHPGDFHGGLALAPDTARDGALGALAVALRLDGAEFGWLELAGPTDRWTGDDVGLAQLVADRVALAVSGTRLREADSRRRGWLSFLAEASDLLAGSLDVTLTLSLVAQLALPTLAEWSAVFTLDDRGEPSVAAVGHVDERLVGTLREQLAGPEGRDVVAAVTGALSSKLSVPLAGVALAVDTNAHTVASGHQRAGLVLPLVARNRTLGALVLGRPRGPRHTPEERSLAEDFSRRAALALDNARLYGDRTAVARALQAWLLPPELPASHDVEFAARYLAAGEGNEVGGDFYDVFSLGDRAWGLAVGDVCGKGAEAAAVTGLVRDVIRLLVREGHAVADVLRRLNHAILEQGDRGRFCTVAAALLRWQDDDLLLAFCSAGHPLPVLMRATGEVDIVGTPGTLVGVTEEFEVREHEVRLGPGDAVVFYTDGVTERRTATKMFGEGRLLDTLRECSGEPAGVIAGALERAVDEYATDPLRDDLAVLVVRRPV